MKSELVQSEKVPAWVTTVLGLYVLLVVATAAAQIQYWPISHYPMFSQRLDSQHKAPFRILAKRKDGSEIWLGKHQLPGRNPYLLKIRNAYAKDNINRIIQLLKMIYRRNGRAFREEVVELTLVKFIDRAQGVPIVSVNF